MSDPQDHIGEYALRVKRDAPEGALIESVAVTLGHKVETRVRNRFITECGREMELELRGQRLVFMKGDPPPTLACQRCFNSI